MRNASSASARKPAFEQVVRTPQTRFADIRRHTAGAVYECVIPEMVRATDEPRPRPFEPK